MRKKPIRIYFWKRRQSSVEQLDIASFERLDHNFYQSEINGVKKAMTPGEFDRLSKYLLEHCELGSKNREYQAFLYEDDREDFTLKFFLEIDFENHTYIAQKGLMPFRQPHYSEIIDVFAPYFQVHHQA